MSEVLDALQGQWPWALAIALGVPVALAVASEYAFALTRRGHPLATSVWRVRNWVAPPIAVALFLRFVLRWPDTSLGVRLAETAALAGGAITILEIVNHLVFEAAPVRSWQQKMPGLLRDFMKVIFVVIAAAVVYSTVWGRQIQGAIAALGVTSIVVGLALQQPLGNLFSGLMLLIERPFEIGETIEVAGAAGEVREINWRSVHIEGEGGSVLIVPNSTLNKETIKNFSRPTPIRMAMVDVNFSFDDPPNKVRAALLETMRGTDGVLVKPRPIAATLSYGDFAVKYRLIYHTKEEDRWPVRNEVITRLWYVARRHGLTMPYPVRVNLDHAEEEPFAKPRPSAHELMTRFPRLQVPPDDLTAKPIGSLMYARGEAVFREGDEVEGVCFVISGAVSLQVTVGDRVGEIASVSPGEFFGEAGMHGIQRAEMRAVATEDSEVLHLGPDTVRALFETSPRLARDTGHALEVRRKALQSVRGALRTSER